MSLKIVVYHVCHVLNGSDYNRTCLPNSRDFHFSIVTTSPVKMESSATSDKFELADDVVKLLKHSERQVKNRASARRSKQRQQKKLEDLRAEYERLTLLDTKLAMYYKELRENTKVVAFAWG